MKTLYLRNVPKGVTERLESLAARAGLSVSAFAIRELGEVARRADNPALTRRPAGLRRLGRGCDRGSGRRTLRSVIVVDASAVVLGLLNDGDARRSNSGDRDDRRAVPC